MAREKFLIILLSLLLVLSLSYIIISKSFLKIKNSLLIAGYSSAVEKLISESENEKCEPFPVFWGEKTVYLINVKCLEKVREGQGD